MKDDVTIPLHPNNVHSWTRSAQMKFCTCIYNQSVSFFQGSNFAKVFA